MAYEKNVRYEGKKRLFKIVHIIGRHQTARLIGVPDLKHKTWQPN